MNKGSTLIWSLVAGLLVLGALGAIGYAVYMQGGLSPSTTPTPPATTQTAYKKLSSFPGVGTLGFDVEIPADWNVATDYRGEYSGENELPLRISPSQIGADTNRSGIPINAIYTTADAKSVWDITCQDDKKNGGTASCKRISLDGQTAYILEATECGDADFQADIPFEAGDCAWVELYIDHPTLPPLPDQPPAYGETKALGRHYDLELNKKLIVDGVITDYSEVIDRFLETFTFNRVESADF